MKSYLAWPVSLKLPNGDTFDGHVTLKYIGSKLETKDLPLIQGMLEGCDTTLDLADVTWKHNLFFNRVPVMVLQGLKPNALRARHEVVSLRDDEFPYWTPHITVPKGLWQSISTGGWTLASMQPHVGPLTWFVDKKPYHRWE